KGDKGDKGDKGERGVVLRKNIYLLVKMGCSLADDSDRVKLLKLVPLTNTLSSPPLPLPPLPLLRFKKPSRRY
ncbi:MAG TPA: hypothetical protein DCY91_11060, partial [Cyanobacteria bacterium UBA11370]|nr:hypothetical protein [Cyanobacteria bacterium UBA11370]